LFSPSRGAMNWMNIALCWCAKGDDDDAVKEQERSQRLEENYRFKWNKNDNEQRWYASCSYNVYVKYKRINNVKCFDGSLVSQCVMSVVLPSKLAMNETVWWLLENILLRGVPWCRFQQLKSTKHVPRCTFDTCWLPFDFLDGNQRRRSTSIEIAVFVLCRF